MGLKKLGLLAVVAAIGVGVAAAASAATSSSTASNALVFGAASDPVIIDGPLVSDGESLRVVDQIFQGLVGLKPGTTQIVPLLATSYSPSKNGLTWTFKLRKGVKFSDGTPFNAAAVCFNFHRWYNFPGPLQNSAVTYYWNTVFGGFAHPAAGNPGPDKSLYKGCKTQGTNDGADPADAAIVVVPRRARADELRHRQPDRAREVQGRRGHRRLERRLPPDRDVRHAAPDRHRAVHAEDVAGRQQAGDRRQPELLGTEAEAAADHLPADRRQRGPAAGAAER